MVAATASEVPLISDRSADDARPLKVIHIAGVSGILAGIRFPQYIKDLDLVIYEKNPDIGGTWWENRYPGCACDAPAHTYQLSFEANPDGRSSTHQLGRSLSTGKQWQLMKLQVVETDEIFEDTADVLVTGIGVLNSWKWPDIPGLHDFQGKLLHSAKWDENFDYKGSALQNTVRPIYEDIMKARLAKRPDMANRIIPPFPPFSKRLTPGPGYLEALTADNVSVFNTRISKVTATGTTTSGEEHRPVDVIVCATGFDTSFMGRFPIRSRKGVTLEEQRQSQRRHATYLSMTAADFPNFFMCMGPNSAVGNGSLVILIERYVEYAAQCMAKMQTGNIRTMAPRPEAVDNFTRYCHNFFKRTVYSEECSSWYKTIFPARSEDEEPVAEVSGLWPGSSLHGAKVLEKPRWEDFKYTNVDGNPFRWNGYGWVKGDREALNGFDSGNPALSY
ncbi:hypothetical protein VTN00DRAFT_2008 [Thermoascus crustaceus]|uniref:uncharacterized protein n=1 Tax=Thermoascus crustaceus TaxID=5088 RepID=UPI003744525E